MTEVRILGVDPGSRYTGWGVIDQVGSRLVWVASGRIEAHKSGELPARLVAIFAELGQIIGQHRPTEAALEKVFVSVNGQATLVLGQARGVALLGLSQAGLAVEEYAPNEVKSAVVGQGKAQKEQVTAMVQVILALQGKKLTEDEADALAVAICHANSRAYRSRAQLREAK
ncbi:MAG: crossover junction endodeoxyribonuclease RuvC [Candidatus Lambdaproteobacteria bacterium RIFOXYD1_FULL_56_27]|uniref:Crossover junction endodeoxyribonuclease RuvC n=1 Tax=Candidatus Lambdaproteobacteria bacterium RIFOXYD2_FULL_56_26 TaxID=1817773 RepID=A0A1F6GQ06_9PROT|nr:MAG: crossover junction endodeoxyribonuclease RuvC [Candidatus Lambdaproteobacteria bacterium RIFOXYD2_FULL_56_26]OGH03647.1 MAG: crossover junction endodeoxyribonuclease RuvC [Candidatus Lambdaproteobacteria bacterium RIFOXYC1_FULL_56_13]OGH07231.1 MAG: crossover junction endodeoxyribonuclease RuvC [Candidatus Lambdaproteobacteria bacterium RIFOXYD1_FULL_56_27]